ncbi:MAG: hypothetical protein HQK66_13170 [Desulfamplus sp.]|nr:hypothetical protein [Desulfamplus sp.]
MKNSPSVKLTRNERDSIFFLTCLYMRIGKMDDAEMILDAMAKQCPEEERTGKYLAAIALEREDGLTALAHLKPLLDRSEIKGNDAPLLLMQARALWLQGQESQSRTVLSEYLTMTGGM